jgi:hypothetical protein
LPNLLKTGSLVLLLSSHATFAKSPATQDDVNKKVSGFQTNLGKETANISSSPQADSGQEGPIVIGSNGTNSNTPCSKGDPRCEVFQSATAMDGSMFISVTNNPYGIPNFTAMTGAKCGDQICNMEGHKSRGATTKWVAWLSTGSRKAKSYIRSNAIYNHNNELVLTTSSDGTPKYQTSTIDRLYRPISHDTSARALPVWTGTTAGGLKASDHCINWTSYNGGANTGTIGMPTSTHFRRWTDKGKTACSSFLQLYCVQIES